MENLTIYAATYNVGTSSPDQSLENLLSVVCNCKDTMKFPDFYILSFQEVKAQPQNLLMDFLFTDDPWTHHCRNILKTKHFIKLKSIRLQGLLLVLFGQRKHLLNIRDLESEYTRTGLAGMWGNKGAVSIRFNIYGCSICFVNSHLSAHDSQLKDRIDDYNSIIKDQEFHVEETKQILFHDYVFWMGDLNFRLSEEYERTPEEIEQLINKNELKTLFEHDQLRSVMKRNEAFSELTEADPDFAPTFKFDVGTMNYNYKRRPAWCDRILYCVNSNNYENVTLKVNQLSYKSHPEYTLSDHKPVSAEFVIKTGKRSVEKDSQKLSVGQVFSDYSENVIEFDKISSWSSDDENKVIYKRTQEFPVTKEDWIGLYKSNFDSLDEYVTYEYVSKCSSPIMDEKSGKSSETVDANRPTKYELTFSELPSHCKGEYCLIYFSQTEDKVSSVLGISNNFNIVKEDSE